MHRALWLVILSLLLQLAAGGVWAIGLRLGPAGHCHDATRAVGGSAAPADASDSADATSPAQQADGHHCCTVGLAGQDATLPCLPPQGAPAHLMDSWVSLVLRPGLRPPI
jgi:hypothetical protein